MSISALSLKFYNTRYFPSALRRDIPTKAQLDQNLPVLPIYMPSLDLALGKRLPPCLLFAMFIDLLVDSKCQIK